MRWPRAATAVALQLLSTAAFIGCIAAAVRGPVLAAVLLGVASLILAFGGAAFRRGPYRR